MTIEASLLLALVAVAIAAVLALAVSFRQFLHSHAVQRTALLEQIDASSRMYMIRETSLLEREARLIAELERRAAVPIAGPTTHAAYYRDGDGFTHYSDGRIQAPDKSWVVRESKPDNVKNTHEAPEIVPPPEDDPMFVRPLE